MKERGIIFQGEMVRAILDGRKTQTRRIIKPQPNCAWNPNNISCKTFGDKAVVKIESEPPVKFKNLPDHFVFLYTNEFKAKLSPYGVPGDRLWVRETFSGPHRLAHSKNEYVYRATNHELDIPFKGHWKPSIHMPRWASRINLEITDIRVEKIQDISGEDIKAEGIDNGKSNPTMGKRHENMQRMEAQKVWDEINGKGAWDRNEHVWVIKFKLLDKS